MSKKILITGGPVHAYLDDVKIITNRFKGGLMVQMAEDFDKVACRAGPNNKLEQVLEIVYLCSKNSIQPRTTGCVKIIHHDGLYDYMEKVLKLTPEMDAVILGAAVANLIPKNKIKGKFPSHNYKEGDTIPIDFTIAPRIIDKVKKIAPKTHLFGFKLLSGVNYNELISAAYGVLLESKATAVFANDAINLMQKYAVTKERSVHPMTNKELVPWILEIIDDEYYRTEFIPTTFGHLMTLEIEQEIQKIVKKYKNNFTKTSEGLVFGTIAVRSTTGTKEGFITTARGKNELEDFVWVEMVNHDKRIVYVTEDDDKGNKKATLNAPLLDSIFKSNPDIHSIVHWHCEKRPDPNIFCLTRIYKYAPPGTVRDSIRNQKVNMKTSVAPRSFFIQEHGCYLLFDKEGNIL